MKHSLPTRAPNHSLPQPTYLDEVIYRRELQEIWYGQWLFVGLTAQVTSPGSYFVTSIGDASVIIIRAANGIQALHNVCRHRGMKLLWEEQGKTSKLVCPYHQWTYSLEGRLQKARGFDLDKLGNCHNLKPVACEVVEGLIFVCLSSEPPEFSHARKQMEPLARPQAMDTAKVAVIKDYTVQANWKIVWENNRECYHCNANHPEYIRANYDHYNQDDTPNEIATKIAEKAIELDRKWSNAEGGGVKGSAGMTTFPDIEHGFWYWANRTPLSDGWVSESLDGKRVAPLMGHYANENTGTLRIRTMPNMWLHASCDHAVATLLLPKSIDQTTVRVLWLVDPSAREGVDYQIEALTGFWKATSEQDWELCENVQKGVRSPGYVPGPLSEAKEYNVEAFYRWYEFLMAHGSNQKPDLPHLKLSSDFQESNPDFN